MARSVTTSNDAQHLNTQRKYTLFRGNSSKTLYKAYFTSPHSR